MKLFRSQKRKTRYRVFFATDVHGSDRCFRKFLAAGKVYEADALILGGDVGGKAIVPFVTAPGGGYMYVTGGESLTISEDELAPACDRVATNGLYPKVCEPSEAERLAQDPQHRRRVFEQLICDQLQGWCDLAAERLSDDVRCIITPGNDDPIAIDEVLRQAKRIECPEREVARLGPIALASLGSTNRTPWATDREFDEDVLTDQIEEMLAANTWGSDVPLVYNFHCPPYNSGLDVAAELDENFRPVIRHGAQSQIPVGSTAVRDAILAHQPVAGLHGHIHESAGVDYLGETACFNPGSEFGSGVLRGLIVDFENDGSLGAYLMTSG